MLHTSILCSAGQNGQNVGHDGILFFHWRIDGHLSIYWSFVVSIKPNLKTTSFFVNPLKPKFLSAIQDEDSNSKWWNTWVALRIEGY